MGRKHNFVDKHTTLAAIIIGVIMLLVSQTIASIPDALALVNGSGTSSGAMTAILAIAATLLVMWFYKRWFRPEFKGVLTTKGLKEGLLLSWPFVIYWIITAVAMSIEHTFGFKGVSMSIRVSVMAGCVEELGFRHGIISTILRNKNQKENYVKICLISAIVFGVIHLFNALQGANLMSTLIQVVSAGCMGVFFAVIFIRTGSILPSIIVHTVHDIYAISVSTGVEATGVVTGGVHMSDIVDVICCIALAIFAIVRYLPDAKREEMVELWDNKWSK